MAVFNFTEATVGIPTLNGVNGTGVAVLDFCFAAAGYSTIASSGNERIYKAPHGLGYCLYVGDDSSISGSAQRMTVRICEDTSTIGSLVNPAPAVAVESNSLSTWMKSGAASATAVAFSIHISDGAGATPPFVIWIPGVFTGAALTCGAQCWGDVLPCQGSDPYLNILTVNHQAATVIDGTGGLASLNGNLEGGMGGTNTAQGYAARDRSGTVIGPRGCFHCGATTGGNVRMGRHANAPVYPHPTTGGMHHVYPTWVCFASQTGTGSGAMMFRGIAPMIRDPLHNGTYTGVNSRDTFVDSAHAATASFTFYKSTNSGMIAVETTDTFTPPSGG